MRPQSGRPARVAAGHTPSAALRSQRGRMEYFNGLLFAPGSQATKKAERSLSSVSGIAEERRLAYVGITRARDRLILTRANTRTRFGRRQTSDPSRFLPEMFGKTASTSSPAPSPSSKPSLAHK